MISSGGGMYIPQSWKDIRITDINKLYTIFVGVIRNRKEE